MRKSDISPDKELKLIPSEAENFKKHLPKNVNTYRHIIDTMQSRDSDVEWILELRAYQNKLHYHTSKDLGEFKPSFYNDDLGKYREKVQKEKKDNKNNTLRLTGNSSDIDHVINRRLNMPANPCQVGFDSTLRHFAPFDKIYGPNIPWKTLAMSPKKNLLSKHLPPMKLSSQLNVKYLSIHKVISRPIEQVEDKYNLNGSQIRRRKFEPSKNETSVFGGEHNASPLYTMKYTQKNINAFRHLLEEQNNSLGLWETNLRAYGAKNRKSEEEKDNKKIPQAQNSESKSES
jgi:hypothetical protein